MEYLNDMALFVEVVKARSFRGAATSIGMPNSTVSRRISLLEKAIGLRLLHRTTRKLELTEAGQVYYERCRRIVEEARLAHEELGEMLAQPSGMIRVSLPVDFATIYLAQAIAEFARRYPDITFDFDLTPRRVDLVSEPFDLAIRIGEPDQPHSIVRQIARLRSYLCASPDYLERNGVPQSPADLAQHDCLAMPGTERWLLNSGERKHEAAASGRFRLNSVGMIRRLASLGMGIANLPEGIIADELQAGRLRRILPEWEGSPTPVYAVTETRLLPAKTRRFIEFLQEDLRSR